MRKLSKGEWVAAAVAVVFVGYTLFGGSITNLSQKQPITENSMATAINPTPSGVLINDVVVGQGVEPKAGDRVSVHYVLSLADGTVIQNSKEFGVPFQFTLGANEVIPGWEQGFVGMKVGGVRNIAIPPELAYGANQQGPIPPNSTLIFTIELLDVTAPTQAQTQTQVQTNTQPAQ